MPKGDVRVGFLFSRYGYVFRALRVTPLDSAQKQAAQEIPRRMAGFIAG
jgi:hypothetical protein